MISESNNGKKRSQSESVSPGTPGPTKQRPRLEWDTSHNQDGNCGPSTLTDGIHMLTDSNANPSQHSEEQDTNLFGPEPADPPLHQLPSCSYPAHDDKEIFITAIRVTDVTLGLRQFPAGFFAVIHHRGRKWRTENKPSSVNHDIVEWDGPIPISSDMSATIRFEVYASSEFQPMLGNGKQLRKLTVTVEQLLDRSEKHSPFMFFPKDGDVVSPCSSIFVTVKWETRGNARPSTCGPHWSNPETCSELEDATDQGHSALSRYRKHREKQDLERSVRQFERALNICSPGHPCRAAAQSNLAMAELIRFQVEGTGTRLDVAFRMYQDALAARPAGHPDRPSTLIHLATAHLVRFHTRKDRSDKYQAQLLWDEVEGSGSADSHARQTVRILQRLHAGWNTDPALSQPHRKPLVGLDAVSRLLDEDPLIFGASLLERFERSGDLADLHQAIAILQEFFKFVPLWDHRYPIATNTLGMASMYRYNRLGELADLEDAISRMKDAVDLIPHDHPQRPSYLSNLGSPLATRFERLGQLSDLEDAISRFRDAVDLTPDGHPGKPRLLRNLGKSLATRFQHLGQLGDLESAILSQRNAIDLTPQGHPERLSLFSNLGSFLTTRFQRLGQLSDIGDAILTLRSAVALTPHDHPVKPLRLTNLGIAFRTRFQCLGELSDLEDAISSQRDAVDLTPLDHPERSSCLNYLGNSLRTRFERLGRFNDLEDAISIQKVAIDLTPQGHPDKPGRLDSLGQSLSIRFEHLSQPSDLEDSISSHRAAVDLTPQGHPQKPSRLNNLAKSLKIRFRHLGQPSDLEDAISRLRDSIDLTPDGHIQKSGQLSNLGASLIARFRVLGQLNDLENAIITLQDAVDLTPDGHPYKPSFLCNLGNSLIARFERLSQRSDLEQAISRLRDAVYLTPHGHPDKANFLQELGNSFETCFERFGEMSKLEQAISLFSHAASSPIGNVYTRFRASKRWISCARRIRHPSLLAAYSVSLNLLPQLAWLGHSLPHRYAGLAAGGVDLVREAAAAVLDAGFPEAAVEWLEQGRSIVWGELLQLRNSCEELSTAHPDHANRLRQLSTDLDPASAPHETFFESEQAPPSVPQSMQSSRHAADRRRRLAIERDELLRKIRRLPGFEQFLRPKRFSQHRASAHAGPVVILNAAETRCDALIVLADLDHVIHVPLAKFTYQRTIGLQRIMKDFVREARVGRTVAIPGVSWESILSTLWTDVVQPVLDALAFSQPRDLSRIFWCPTGPFTFLPIHAAGLYGTEYSQLGYKLSDFHISSYVPTLSILAPVPRPDPCAIAIDDLRILGVRQPSSDGLPPLSGVGPELEHIRNVIGKSPAARTILVESPQGTVKDVLKLMKDADWVHFACHGVQDPTDPTQSGLCLAHKHRLTLRDIIALHRPRGGLAFLSACETAKGDQHLSDEATHIAAGMLFAGYGGVVGTMWTISDRLAPEVAKDVYAYLFRGGKRPDYREAARALHEAVGRARRGGASFNNWIPFVHLGF